MGDGWERREEIKESDAGGAMMRGEELNRSRDVKEAVKHNNAV